MTEVPRDEASDLTPPPTPPRPALRGALHAAAALAAQVAAVALVLRAATPADRAALSVYGATMTGLLVISAAYHRGAWSPMARRRMKALDHVTIFAFIFGSYVPLAVVTLGAFGRTLFLGSLAALCLIGTVVKLRLLDRIGGPADVVYGIATWWGLLIVGPAARALDPLELALLYGGTALFALSAAVLGRRWLDLAPRTFGYHEVAHAVVVAGIACHYLLFWRVTG